MYDIICCIIFGFFTIIGISNTIIFLIESFFKFDNFNKENLTADNAEYVLRSLKYYKTKFKISKPNKIDKELDFIHNKLYQKSTM